MNINFLEKLLKYLDIDIENEKFSIEDVLKGYDVEMEHGSANPKTNVTNDNPTMTLKIALAHLYEDPEYYDKLDKYVENEDFISESFLNERFKNV